MIRISGFTYKYGRRVALDAGRRDSDHRSGDRAGGWRTRYHFHATVAAATSMTTAGIAYSTSISIPTRSTRRRDPGSEAERAPGLPRWGYGQGVVVETQSSTRLSHWSPRLAASVPAYPTPRSMARVSAFPLRVSPCHHAD